jgi:hypothetical protein
VFHLSDSGRRNLFLILSSAGHYVYSILLYGAESWTLNKMMEDKINAFEMWLYRRIGHISWKEKTTNKTVLEKLGMKHDLLKEVKI